MLLVLRPPAKRRADGEGDHYNRSDAQSSLHLLYMLAAALVAEGGILTWACFERLKELLKLNHQK